MVTTEPNYIASSSKLDDEDVFRDRLVVFAAIAMHAEFFVRSARDIAPEMAAILLVK